MKHLLFILFLTLCATAHAQTIRTLGYNSTNGQILAATNVVWTNSFSFSTNTVAAQVRTNVGLPLPALTNTSNVTAMRALGGSTNTNEPFSGSLVFIDDAQGTNVLTVSNGIILKLEVQ